MALPVRSEQQNKESTALLLFYIVFLESISKNQDIKNDPQFLYFIHRPVVAERRKLKIFKQCYLDKKAGGRHAQDLGAKISLMFSKQWKNRCFTVSNQGIFYSEGYEQKNCDIMEMLPFSSSFSISCGQKSTGFPLGINLHCPQRILHLKAESILDFLTFIHAAKSALQECKYNQIHRFGSFSQVRQNCDGKAYADGEEYFRDMYYALVQAKRQVFMTGWMITPYFLLVRPASLDSEFRLDRVLKKIADNGVKVNIIVFQEIKMALNNDSEHVEQHLMSLSPNIKVLRHPKFIMIPFLWSHHEKMVIIDQTIGFMGGLDICYGRWDNHLHKLTELKTNGTDTYFWQGADFCNHRMSDIYKPRQFQSSIINRETSHRMPWHDIAIQLRGGSVIDLSRHFVQYWNFVNYSKKSHQRNILMQSGYNNKQFQQKKQQDIDKLKQQKKNPFLKKAQSYRKPQENNFNEIQQLVKSDYGQQHNQHKQQQFQEPKQIQEELFQVSNENQQVQEYYKRHARNSYRASMNIIHDPLKSQIFEDPFKAKIFQTQQKTNQIDMTKQSKFVIKQQHSNKGTQKHQLLRSSSKWGLGLQQKNQEKSIYTAYLHLIENAREFIYIENQFFMSVQNKISDVIYDRICRAHKQQKKFRIVVVMPLMPAFQGQIESQTSTVLRIQMHLQYQTISRGGNSLFEKLKKNGIKAEDYIQFFGLRTHDILKGKPITEIVYVHSKLMIVDDLTVLIGSANINDRSLLGTRDSELAVIVQDQSQAQYKRGDKDLVKVKKFAHQFRIRIFCQHFGLTKQEVEDPINDVFWNKIRKQAFLNTQIYRNVFGCYPDSTATDFEKLAELKKASKLQNYTKFKDFIKGFAVEFPKDFLKDQNLKFKSNQVEYYVPEISFT